MNRIYKVTVKIILIFILVLFLGTNKSYCSDFWDTLKDAGNTIWYDGVVKVYSVLMDINDKLEFLAMAVNPVGIFINERLDEGVIPLIDSVQETLNAMTLSTILISYPYAELEENLPDLDKYTKVGQFVRADPNYKYEVLLEDEDIYVDYVKKMQVNPNSRFNGRTSIPIIKADLYGIAVNDLDMLDINFLRKDKDETKTPWKYIRNFTSNAVHISLYFATAFLTTQLIYNGVQIVRSSISNPRARKEHIEAIQRVFTSALMLVGTIIFMALIIYGEEMLYSIFKTNDSEEFPIRIHVEEAGYSFSTNVIGYVKYMTQIRGANYCLEKSMYTLCYGVFVLVNILNIAIMVIRMFVMMFLAIVGAIIASLHVLDIKWPMEYKKWVWLYIRVSLWQVCIAIVYRLSMFAFE